MKNKPATVTWSQIGDIFSGLCIVFTGVFVFALINGEAFVGPSAVFDHKIVKLLNDNCGDTWNLSFGKHQDMGIDNVKRFTQLDCPLSPATTTLEY